MLRSVVGPDPQDFLLRKDEVEKGLDFEIKGNRIYNIPRTTRELQPAISAAGGIATGPDNIPHNMYC